MYNYNFENWNIKVNTKNILKSLHYFNHWFKPKYQKPQLLMKSIKTLESINLEDVPEFNNNNEHYKNHIHLNPPLTDLGVNDLGDTYLPKKDPYDRGSGRSDTNQYNTYNNWTEILCSR